MSDKTNQDKGNRALTVTVIVCAAIVAALVITLAFGNCWAGYAKLSKVRGNIEGCDEILISSPAYYDAYSSGAEAVLSGNDAKALANDFLSVSSKKDYQKTLDSSVGYWDTKITFYMGDDTYSVYVDENGFYVTGNSGYYFESKDTQAYSDFYAKVCGYLEN